VIREKWAFNLDNSANSLIKCPILTTITFKKPAQAKLYKLSIIHALERLSLILCMNHILNDQGVTLIVINHPL